MIHKRLVYLGTPEAAVAPLRALVEAGFDIALVVSQPDRKRGRGGAMVASPVKAAALELGLAVSDEVADVMSTGAELGVVVAFGKLIKQDVLDVVPMVNLHFSLLPRWRGAAPVERAILAGDLETGVCLMSLEAGLDTGPVYERVVVPIGPNEMADELRSRLVELGIEMLVRNLTMGLGSPEPQAGEATYASKLDPAELAIDWNRSLEEVHRLCRIGMAWTRFRGKRLKICRAHANVGNQLAPGEVSIVSGLVLVGTGTDALELVEVQPEGKSRQLARDWANGARPAGDERLG